VRVLHNPKVGFSSRRRGLENALAQRFMCHTKVFLPYEAVIWKVANQRVVGVWLDSKFKYLPQEPELGLKPLCSFLDILFEFHADTLGFQTTLDICL
jgi:hypothetical protein